MEKDLILSIEDLKVEYRTDDGVVNAVNGLDLVIEKGQTHGLVGETGAGKTTTALSVLDLIQSPPGVIVGGEIKLDGQSIRGLKDRDMEKIRGGEVSMIFQDPMTSLNPVMTIEDQIAEVIRYHQPGDYKDAIAKTHEMLTMVGLPPRRGKEYPHQFSGGMKQRVVIAMALACRPKLLLADEPTTALDVTIQAQVLELMKELKEKYGTSMMMITHDLGVVAEVCDKVSVIYSGRVIEHGNLEDVFDFTRHPYTEGLFNSLPNLQNRTAELKPIKGLMPDPTDLPSGCPFHPRCDYAMDICSKEHPPKVFRNDEHFVECHLYTNNDIKKGGVINRG
ncbi:ABC transporter ATP-binding protein [Acidaminobacter sp. JC074]|uniref:ABC transporter ATP-binding protein n=1 Tax=Acidaminobacter sp. JC074 TaxID=2530199 RepID=UPI001F0DA5DA|nr:ABC transporter ATP-binding protein [Acidaminobacter sp. JC074]MCH4887908.1 ABC transporter ATP-binding protein [Acidaminobacter sp. JC074]